MLSELTCQVYYSASTAIREIDYYNRMKYQVAEEMGRMEEIQCDISLPGGYCYCHPVQCRLKYHE